MTNHSLTRTLGLSALLMVSAALHGQTTAPLSARLDAIFDSPKFRSAHWGVMIKDLDSSEVLYQREAEKSFMPASNMKLFTTAASLCTLGKDYRFETKIYATGTTDTQGTLHGNIYIVGSGDPSISGRYNEDLPTTAILQQWAGAIAGMGIRKIDGDIIGDDDIFDDKELCGSWQVDYIGDWYAAESSGLAMNDNCWDLDIYVEESRLPNIVPGEPVKFIRKPVIRPWAPIRAASGYNTISLENVKFIPNNDDTITSPPREEAELSIERMPDSNVISLSGTIEEDSGTVHEWGSVHNGTLYALTMLKNELVSQSTAHEKIEITGKCVDIDDMDRQLAAYLKQNPGTLVHTHVSPPLSRIIAMVNKPSQNFYADMLLKVIGAKAHGLGSWHNGELVVHDVLTTAGVDYTSLNMEDGSGLSRKNLVEPQQVVGLLTYMHSRPDFDVFEASLPIMGKDGTLKGRMAGTPAEGNVKAKTGTISGARALSGYMTAPNGHRLVFSMIGNNYATPTSDATEAQNQAIMELLAQ